MRRRGGYLWVPAASLFLALGWFPSVASAWTCAAGGGDNCIKWCSDAVTYVIGNTSSDLGEVSTIAEIRAGMGDWAKVSCAALDVDYGGRASNRPGRMDGTYIVSWSENRWAYGSLTIGITLLWFENGGECIIDADIDMNGVDYTWTLGPGSGRTVNTYTIMLHEGGHFMGLGHTGDTDAVMFPTYDGGVKFAGDDDIEGICSIYDGPGSPDCNVVGCPRGQFCTVDGCVAPDGPGLNCMPCEENADCGDEDDRCIDYGEAGTFCGRTCEQDSDCGGGATRCLEIDGGTNQCVRLDINDEPNCDGCRVDAECNDRGPDFYCAPLAGTCLPIPPRDKSLGDPCVSNLECLSELCTVIDDEPICTTFCDRLATGEETDCPIGFFCGGPLTLACDSGLCIPGLPGLKGPTDACNSDTECETFVCYEGECVQPCLGVGQSTCDDGYSCSVIPGGCGFCRTNGEVGDPCRLDTQCLHEDAYCLDYARSNRVCTIDCNEETVCPIGSLCSTLEAGLEICLPPASGLKALGEDCVTLQECDTGICIPDVDGIAFCSQLCQDSRGCPAGFNCQQGFCTLSQRDKAPTFFPSDGGGNCSAAVSAEVRPSSVTVLTLLMLGLATTSLHKRRRRRRVAR